MKKRTPFDYVFVVNLKEKKERLEKFRNEWKDVFPDIRVFEAIDGKNVGKPSWWSANEAAYGCYRSHLSLIERVLSDSGGTKNVLIFEDDAVKSKNFGIVYEKALEELPNDWDVFYLGGQRVACDRKDFNVSKHLLRCHNVNRLHAYAVSGKALKRVYEKLTRSVDWSSFRDAGGRRDHIDDRFMELCKELNAYCVDPFVVGQREGLSSISGRTEKERFWNND